MIGTTFNRYLGSAEDVPAGMYALGEHKQFRLACPLCGERFDLPSGSGPDFNGRTRCAIHCPSQCCFWWDMATLSDCWLTDEECRK